MFFSLFPPTNTLTFIPSYRFSGVFSLSATSGPISPSPLHFTLNGVPIAPSRSLEPGFHATSSRADVVAHCTDARSCTDFTDSLGALNDGRLVMVVFTRQAARNPMSIEPYSPYQLQMSDQFMAAMEALGSKHVRELSADKSWVFYFRAGQGAVYEKISDKETITNSMCSGEC